MPRWIRDFGYDDVYDIVMDIITILMVIIGIVVIGYLIFSYNPPDEGPYIEVTSQRINAMCPKTGVAQVANLDKYGKKVAVTCKSGKTAILIADYKKKIHDRPAEGSAPLPLETQ